MCIAVCVSVHESISYVCKEVHRRECIYLHVHENVSAVATYRSTCALDLHASVYVGEHGNLWVLMSVGAWRYLCVFALHMHGILCN